MVNESEARAVRRVVILVVLIALLAGLVALQQFLANWHYVLAGEPGELLYIATFDRFEDEWGLQGLRLEPVIADGVMRFDVNDIVRSPYATTKPHFSDFDLRLEARPVSGPLNNGYGVVFRLQDPQNFYRFLVSSDGFYRVDRMIDGVEKDLSTWIKSPVLNAGVGVTNWLRVVAVGEQFQFFINNQPVQLCVPDDPAGESTYFLDECVDGTMVDMLQDDSFASGQIGPAVLTLDEKDVVIEFDNLVVLGAAAPSEAEE
jgi:hypothetical protein